MYECMYCGRSFDNRRQVTAHQSRCPKQKPLKLGTSEIPAVAAVSMTAASSKSSYSNITSELQDHDTIDAPPSPPPDGPPELIPESIPSPLPSPLPEKRVHKTPQHLVDFLPSDPRPLQQFSEEYARLDELCQTKRHRAEPEVSGPLSSPLPPPQLDPLETEPDDMGLFCCYKVPPSRDPNQDITVYHVADAPTFMQENIEEESSDPLGVFGPTAREIRERSDLPTSIFFPFLNASVLCLMSWFYSAKKLTLSTLDRLVQSVILAPDFKCEHFEGFSAVQENKRLDDSHVDTNDNSPSSLPAWFSSDKWQKASVKLPLPLTGKSYQSERHAPTLKIDYFRWDLVEVFKSGIQNYATKKFHWRGFKLFWKPSSDEPEQRVYGEVYTSDHLLELEDNIIPVEGCNLERAVVPLMLYSDSTQLANFGTASLWPLYMWFGGLSKYTRGKASTFSAHHLAYLPSLPDLVKDRYKELFGTPATPPIITFLCRELLQAVWKDLLTDKFKEIYESGIVLRCGDKIQQRLYPQFFAYSADYKERWFCKGNLWGLWLSHTAGRGRSKVYSVLYGVYKHNYSPGRGRSKENKSGDLLCQV